MTSRSELSTDPGDRAREKLRRYADLYLKWWLSPAYLDAEEELISALVAHADGAEVERHARVGRPRRRGALPVPQRRRPHPRSARRSPR